MEELLQVGVITSTHGIKGEVKIYPTTSDVKRFETLKKVLLDTGTETIPLEIQGVKYFKQFVILKFKGIDSINEIEKYKTRPLLVTREQAIPCEQDEYFIADLIGMQVIDEEEKELGILQDVLETGANDVYVVLMNDGKEVLLPAIRECIIKVDLATRSMKVHMMEGLL